MTAHQDGHNGYLVPPQVLYLLASNVHNAAYHASYSQSRRV